MLKSGFVTFEKKFQNEFKDYFLRDSNIVNIDLRKRDNIIKQISELYSTDLDTVKTTYKRIESKFFNQKQIIK